MIFNITGSMVSSDAGVTHMGGVVSGNAGGVVGGDMGSMVSGDVGGMVGVEVALSHRAHLVLLGR